MFLKDKFSEEMNTSESKLIRTPFPHRSSSFLPRKSDDLNIHVRHPFSQKNFEPKFPSTRFYGSKRRHLGWLKDELGAVAGQTALDAFGGTGAVSHLLASLGWRTTYNDIFEFNTVAARAVFSMCTFNITEEYIVSFLCGIVPVAGFISKNFNGIYFYDDENSWLDGFMLRLESRPKGEQDLLLYCLFQACLKKRPFNLFHRANLNIRSSVVPVQFGNRTTWNKSFSDHILQTYRELREVQRVSIGSVSVLDGANAKDVKGEYDLVYLDPPYFKQSKRNTDTYLQRYHFLEGLARFSDWPKLIDCTSAQKMIRAPYRGELTNKRNLLDEIQNLFRLHPASTFALSYVAGEEPTEHELFTLFKKNFDSVRLSRRSFSKVLSNKESYEILLIGK